MRHVPISSSAGQPYWEAASKESLVVQRCQTCGHLQMYPGYLCKVCRSRSLGWQQVSGFGTIYSYSVQHRPVAGRADAGTIVAVIALDEGPRMLSNIVGADGTDRVRIGARVQVDFLHHDQFTLPVFRIVHEDDRPADLEKVVTPDEAIR